jgi:hypothetical protein
LIGSRSIATSNCSPLRSIVSVTGVPLLARQAIDALVVAQAERGLPVDLHHLVVGHQPDAERRRVLQRRSDRQPPVADLDLRPDADVLARELLFELPLHLRRDVHRVRVIQRLDHPLDRAVAQRRLIRLLQVEPVQRRLDVDQRVEERKVVALRDRHRRANDGHGERREEHGLRHQSGRLHGDLRGVPHT